MVETGFEKDGIASNLVSPAGHQTIEDVHGVVASSLENKPACHLNHHRHCGASPNSHKHFFPCMGFCASIWDNVRHHCHHHHHHHHIQKSKSINTEACLIAH